MRPSLFTTLRYDIATGFCFTSRESEVMVQFTICFNYRLEAISPGRHLRASQEVFMRTSVGGRRNPHHGAVLRGLLECCFLIIGMAIARTQCAFGQTWIGSGAA